MATQFSGKIGDKVVTIETGKLAQQAGGAVTIRMGDTLLLATATAAKSPREGVDFFPLTVDYEERLYAAGRIPGGFFKREGRPSETAILICRLVDRPLRPLFPKGFRTDVQVVLTSLSSDQDNPLDVLAIVGASAALTISDIPFEGPIAGVRVGLVDGDFVINPTYAEIDKSTLDLRMAGTADAILMVEAGAQQVPEDVMLEALRLGHQSMQEIIELQRQMQAAVGKPKRSFPLYALSHEVRSAVQSKVGDRFRQVLRESSTKEARSLGLESLEAAVMEELEPLAETYEGTEIKQAYDEEFKHAIRHDILEYGKRPDGRDPKTIRPIYSEVNLLPRAHGSGLFQRGETQVLSIVTLGAPGEEQMLDNLGPDESKRYMHHYNMPPFATGEATPMRGPRRREIGHGALAETALRAVVPAGTVFPYTVRVVSEVLSSNGSTSMASVCGSTLALMDAGVPILAPVAGVAMGLVKEDEKYQILTDIQGMEDNLGDMDFKVAGTSKGITALQMDMKIRGISMEILRQALSQALEGRLFILGKMLEVMPKSRSELSPMAPLITVIKIEPEKIGAVIGPGGKMIRKITEETGAKIDIEDDGSVFITAPDGISGNKAKQMIEGLTADAEVGKIYTGKVVRITDFGAFVEILPGKDGLVHISQLASERVNSVEDVVRVGDEIMVMVIAIDEDRKIRLSRVAVLEGWTAEKAREMDKRPSGGRRPQGDNRSDGGRRDRR
ncbi:MAG: polyribonucleotide nucleotidyltransferase [Chloroflexi bacterium]|nr:polyribonucleotide nucleotidyltransferase [Chloroflexota bacterium]